MKKLLNKEDAAIIFRPDGIELVIPEIDPAPPHVITAALFAIRARRIHESSDEDIEAALYMIEKELNKQKE
jgi:hypothetical protein